MTIDRWCHATGSRLARRINVAAATLRRPVSIHVADAAATGLPERSADIVTWDPPVYDNSIDYQALARPHELMLAALSEILPTDIAINSRRALQRAEHHSSFNKSQYEAQITAQAEEITRVLRASGRLAVFWPARAPADLQNFLDRIAPAGLELEQAVRISRGEPVVKRRASDICTSAEENRYPCSSQSQVDAARVLQLADEDRPSLTHGLADILIRRMAESDIDNMIPSHTRGTREARLAEYLASHADPAHFLTELGRGELREQTNGPWVGTELMVNKTARQLANVLLEDLGFQIPQAPTFSVKEALNEATRALNDLQYATSIDAAQGSAGTCFIQIERTLRYSVVAWSFLPASGPGLLRSVMESHGRSFNPARLSFGDWKLLFTQIPQRLRDMNPGVEIFGSIARAMRQGRSYYKLSSVISARNDIQHDRDPTARAETATLIRRVTDAVRDANSALAELYARRLLPITTTPQEEIRDRFGQRRLVLAELDANRIEVDVEHETDLSRPLVYIASGSNPRDVNPTLLSAREIEQFLSS